MHQVRYFLAVAEHLNFTRAAERLHVAQPSLTRAIQKLEDELNGPLFRRERLNTHLTELGRMMLPHLQATLASAEAAKRQARSFHKRETGQLRIGICGGVSAAVLAPLLAAVTTDVADLDLHVETSPATVTAERLATGEIDVAVLAPVGDAPERLDLHPILDDAFVVAFRPGHRFERENELTLETLDGEPLVVRTSCEHEAALAAAMHARGLIRIERHRSPEDAWLGEMVRAGIGCLVVPEATARAFGLPYRSLVDITLVHRTALATVAGRRHSPALASLVRHVRARWKSTPPIASEPDGVGSDVQKGMRSDVSASRTG